MRGDVGVEVSFDVHGDGDGDVGASLRDTSSVVAGNIGRDVSGDVGLTAYDEAGIRVDCEVHRDVSGKEDPCICCESDGDAGTDLPDTGGVVEDIICLGT